MKLLTITAGAIARDCRVQVPRLVMINQQQRNASNASTALQNDTARSLALQIKRDWKIGDVYAPHDLSAAEQRKWSKKHSPDRDVFDILAIDPMSLYKASSAEDMNVSVMTDFVTETGRIKPRSETGLRPVNQRKVAKAIRRAIALGFMPSAYKHPMLVKEEIQTLAQHQRIR